ncbi:hypothetical protein CEP54_012970 [Fusarium duplospermum]|uniref:Protein kinase domain-containing protein n=1 Tax=Fusarium duplospermum TaxID=1325734 RepID=A0A428P5N0_9HYPO|nr:hypothetical protein CEP54_012970 [Fusarium duplospermum]
MPEPVAKEGAEPLPVASLRDHPPPSIRSDDISEAAAACRSLFEEYLQAPRLFRKQVAEFQGRFSTWAAFLGVFVPAKACLDTRLASTPEMKELVISMLTVLRRNLEHGIKRHRVTAQNESDSETSAASDGAIVGIAGAMDRLNRLAHIIRRSSKPSKVERVLDFARKRQPGDFGNKILDLIKSKFHSMAESLQVQLASSIVYRRNRLLYQNRCEGKLQTDMGHETVSVTVHTGDHSDTNDACSDVSLINTEYPNAPTVPPGHADAQCPICRTPQPRRVMEDEKKWRLHVDQDLQPYVCISEECGNLPPAFATRAAWLNHMQHKKPGSDWAQYIHRPHRWLCALRHDGRLAFDSENLLLEHLRRDHCQDIPGPRRPVIASKSKVPVPLEATTCPLCHEQVSVTSRSPSLEDQLRPTRSQTPSSPSGESILTTSGKDALSINMWEHIAEHLECLALWSLPRLDKDSGASAEIRSLGKIVEQALPDMSLPVESPMGLEDRVSAASMSSQFPHPNTKFIPADMVDNLVTKDVILEKIPGVFDSEDGVQLASYILAHARRIFTITAVHCGLNSQELKTAITHFKEQGFGDGDLPIPDPSRRDQQKAAVPLSLPQSKWTIFYQSQWRYSAPVFLNEVFNYQFEPNHIIMPFTWVSARAGGLGSAFEVRIHQAHQEYFKVDNNAHIKLVLNQFNPTDLQDSQLLQAWSTESTVAKRIRHLNHPHITNALAAMEIGSKRYLMFPCADGGSLRDYWSTFRRPRLSRDFVADVIDQLRGLADALDALHRSGYRHGDLKPESILRSEAGASLGRLKLADLERVRRSASSNTVLYASPEVNMPSRAQPQLTDLWSMGCIIVDFIVWLLYGWDELSRFHSGLNGFFQVSGNSSNSQVNVHSDIVDWMDHISKDQECSGQTALGDLLRLVKEKLLVVNITAEDSDGDLGTRRATAHELRDDLASILSNENAGSGYFYTGRSREGLVGYHASPDTTDVPIWKGEEDTVDMLARIDIRRQQDIETTERSRGSYKDGTTKRPDGNESPKKRLDCPFHKLDPERYQKCEARNLETWARCLQHLRRCHLRTGLCCRNCRTEFEEEAAWAEHIRGGCQPATPIDAGFLLETDYNRLKRLPGDTDEKRWFSGWDRLFPGEPLPSSPYVESLVEIRRRHACNVIPEILQPHMERPQDVYWLTRKLVDAIFNLPGGSQRSPTPAPALASIPASTSELPQGPLGMGATPITSQAMNAPTMLDPWVSMIPASGYSPPDDFNLAAGQAIDAQAVAQYSSNASLELNRQSALDQIPQASTSSLPEYFSIIDWASEDKDKDDS